MLVFLHIPKTAGTSFASVLTDLSSRVCPSVTDDHLRHRLAELAGHDLLIGHVTFHAVRSYLPHAEVVTMLREPVARAISQYQSWHDLELDQNWRHHLEHDQVAADVLEFTKKADIHEYFASEWEPVTRQFTNFQTYTLSGRDIQTTRFQVWEPEVLEAAKENLSSMTFFGLTERMQDSITLLHELINPAAPVPKARADNRSARRSEQWRDEQVERRIRACSPMDLELYAWARDLFEKRVQAHGFRAAAGAR